MFYLEDDSVPFLMLCLRDFDLISANSENCKQFLYGDCLLLIMSLIFVFGVNVSFEIYNNL